MYILLENNVVMQTQPNDQKGFVFTDKNVVCGQVEKDGLFFNPDPVILPLTSKDVRDKALAAIDNYDLKDGRVIQIRIKEDRDNLKGGIKKGQTLWKMLDNKVYTVTTADLQTALDDQESQISAIWMTHFADLEVGKAKKVK